MSQTITVTTTSTTTGGATSGGSSGGGGGLYIVNGVITTNATATQRASGAQPFPGTGYTLGGQPPPPPPPPPPQEPQPMVVTSPAPVLRLNQGGPKLATGGGGGGPPPPPPPSPGTLTAPPPQGPGHRLGGRDLMAENREWGMSRSESLAQIHQERLSQAAVQGPDLAANFQAAFGDFFAARQRQAQRPPQAINPGNPCNQHSLLPTLTPAEIRELELIFPKPPLPCGYAKSNFDLHGILSEFNSENPYRMLKVIQRLAKGLRERHLDSKMMDALVASMERVIARLRQDIVNNIVSGCPEKNEALLLDALAYFEKMVNHQQVIFDRARTKIRDYDATKAQCRVFKGELPQIKLVHLCFAPLVDEANRRLDVLATLFGEAFLEEFSLALAPLMIRIRLLRQILNRRTNPGGRILMIHRNCSATGYLVNVCRNRLGAPGDGRKNPNWTGQTFVPLHFHTSGFSESLIFSWKGMDCLFVHGVVPFHMDQDMSGGRAKIANAMEKLRENERDFEEHLLFGDQIVPLSVLLGMSITELQDFLRNLG